SSALLAQTPASKSADSKGTASKTGAARPSLLNPASLHAKAPDVYKAQFMTTKGDIVLEVHRDWAPIGADRFYNLVKNGFFNNTAFFRVVPGFMVQFGLAANPAVNKAWQTANIKDDPVKQSNKRGMLTFAKTSLPNSRSTQLYINFGDNASLDPQGFAPIGSVVEGMDIVDKIYAGYGERPEQDKITDEGDAYIMKNFPMIDKIKMAKILPAEPAAAPAEKK
ncbi:MAG TPA: peptidylprolyl isomerase, partial [Bryobacteraceae bacterium]|nr:peptidylprolyl isomerase [Bryobacteraceae bacterium]